MTKRPPEPRDSSSIEDGESVAAEPKELEVHEEPERVSVSLSSSGSFWIPEKDKYAAGHLFQGSISYNDRCPTKFGPAHLSYGRGSAFLLPEGTEDTYYFQVSEDPGYVYAAVPEPPPREYYLMPKGWEETGYTGVLKIEGGKMQSNPLRLQLAPEARVEWASEDPYSDTVIQYNPTYMQHGFAELSEKTFELNSADFSLKMRLLEVLGKKEVDAERLGINVDSLLHEISVSSAWGFLETTNTMMDIHILYELGIPKKESVRARFIIRHGKDLVVQHPTLDIKIGFTYEDLMARGYEIATSTPEGEISEEIKARLLRFHGLSKPHITNYKEEFVKDKMLEKNPNFDPDDYYTEWASMVRDFKLTEQEQETVNRKQEELDAKYALDLAEFERRVKALELRNYEVLWVGNTPFKTKGM